MNSPGMMLREGMTLIGQVGGPMMLALLVAGLVLGVLQAATQINDPAVSFLPRLLVAAVITAMMGTWMSERMARFLVTALERMAERGV